MAASVADDSLHRAISLLQKYSWIYDFQLTQFFIERIWEKIPEKWCEDLFSLTTDELGEIPYGYLKNSWSPDLRTLVDETIALSLPRQHSIAINPVTVAGDVEDKRLHVGMTAKKIHEVDNMAAFVDEFSRQGACNIVVDAGAGMGYLDKLLNSKYGHDVLGLESKHQFTHGAKIKLQKRGFDCDCGIQLETLELNESRECFDSFRRTIHDFYRKRRRKNGGDSNGASGSTGAARDLAARSTGAAHDLAAGSTGAARDLAAGSTGAADARLQECNNTVGPLAENLCELNLEKTRQTQNNEEKLESNLKHFTETSENVDNYEMNRCDLCDEDSSRCRVNGNIVGLHCCADLTPTVLRLFSNCSSLRRLVCVSCCYHRMSRDPDSGSFNNFPLSRAVRDVLNRVPWKPSVYCFRLAAQETRVRWRNQTAADHEFHMKNVAYRGLIELYAKTSGSNGASIVKLRRRVARRSHFQTFDGYLDAVFERSSGPDWSNSRHELKRLHRQYEQYFKYIQIITLLQVLLQPVIESLIATDRRLLLAETPGITADVIPIFDEMISPRNLAIVAYKSHPDSR
ncbi:putative methyltransferase-like protein 25 [Tubulanus polymorphus]|uniref:putative methyltransferase-like protein 25 n=1 Tax=Tubulanus polymorphus TaxID=672921 RepID=UPI003DA388D2